MRRLPKGFGKNYFTLAAIQATVTQCKLDAAAHILHDLQYQSQPRETEEETPPEDPLLIVGAAPSNCSCRCSSKSRRVIKALPRQNYPFAHYIRTQSVSSPPSFYPDLISNPNNTMQGTP